MDIPMEMSLFLAKLLGLYFLVVSLLCFFRHHEMKITGKELISSRSALAVSAEISLLFGLVIVIDHSLWEASWRVLVTILGYLLVLRGVLRYAFPVQVKKMWTKVAEKGCGLITLIMLVIGAYLTYCGFVNS
jgi:hypothetical protein